MTVTELQLLEKLMDEKIQLAVNTPHGMVAIGAGCMPAIDVALRRIAAIRAQLTTD